MKDKVENANWNLDLATFGAVGRKQLEAAIAIQQELVGSFEEMNRMWVGQMRSKIELAMHFVVKLTEAKSVPDVLSAYDECASRQLEILAEDKRLLIINSEKILQAGAPLILTNGSVGLGT